MENSMVKSESLQMLQAQSEAQFAMTPTGQYIRQFEAVQKVATAFSQSSMVPVQYQSRVVKRVKNERGYWDEQVTENPNALANCVVAINMAVRMNADPMMTMQNLQVINGNPTFSAKFLIACINQCGRFTALRYECNNKKGDEYGWRAFAYDLKDMDTPLLGDWITWKMVKAEQWDAKQGSKWLSMPEQMFRYRAAAFWQRVYAPEISMGFITTEEANDIKDAEYTEIHDTKSMSAQPLIAQAEAPAEAELPTKKVKISSIILKAAIKNLDDAKTAEEVLKVRDMNKVVYNNDEAFREALDSKFEELSAQQMEQEQTAADPMPITKEEALARLDMLTSIDEMREFADWLKGQEILKDADFIRQCSAKKKELEANEPQM